MENMDGTGKKGDEESAVLADSRKSIFVDYVEFWQAIEESQEMGHSKLRKLLDERKIHIGDSIPNKDFWLQIKEDALSKQQNKSNGLTDKPPSYKTLVRKDEPGEYIKMVEFNLKSEKNDQSDGSTEEEVDNIEEREGKSEKNDKSDGSTEEEVDNIEADIEQEGIFRKTYTTGSVKYCQQKNRLVHSYSKKRPNQKINDAIENKNETDGYGYDLMKSFNKKQVNGTINETIEKTDEAGGYMRLKEERSSLNKITPERSKLEQDQVPEGHLYRLGKKLEGALNDTVFRIILDNVYNGHELILHVLDSLVSKTSVNECSDCFGYTKKDEIKVDLGPLFKRKRTGQECLKDCRNKMRLIHDLIEIQYERGEDENIKKIFKHPVLEILILKKWEEKQNWYFHSVRQFMLFVLLFTFFVRMKILESNTPKLMESDVDDNFMSNMKSGRNITFTASMVNKLGLDIDEQVVDGSNKAMQILDTYNSSRDFVYKILNVHDNGTFTAVSRGKVPSFFKVFYNKGSNVILFGFVMSVLIISQISFVFIYFIEQFTTNSEENNAAAPKSSDTGRRPSFQKRKSRRRQRNVAMHGWNVVYLITGTFVCLISALDGGFCLRLILMVICSLLLILEMRQQSILVKNAAKGNVSMAKFFKKVRQKRYFKDPENYLELIFLISVPVSIIYDGWEDTQPMEEVAQDRNSALWTRRTLCRGFIAMGVFSAWIELVIKMGNISLSVVGDFIKMFYNIIKDKLLSYMKVCFLLITAFSFSFWIILEGQLENKKENFSTGFWFSQVLTTTMSIGEFNTVDFYESIKGNQFSKVFALIFLVMLICLSTITMINLLVAAIISDYNAMKEEVYEENLYFIAEYIIEAEKYQRRAENGLPTTIFNIIYPNELITREDFKITEDYCPHLICNDCGMEPLPIPRPGTSRFNPAKEANQRKPLLGRLLEICGINEKLCSYHLKKWDKEMQEITVCQG